MEISTSCRKILRSLVVILGIISCGLLGIGNGTALAGSHGQRINYEKRHAYKECSSGTNQEGEFLRDVCIDPLEDGSNRDNKNLWIGRVTVIWYYMDHDSRRSIQGDCNVPESQSGDFFTCFDPT
jgi:hypothetical protein